MTSVRIIVLKIKACPNYQRRAKIRTAPCIFALINDDNAEFNLRVDHGLHELVRDWLLDSSAPAS